MNWKHSLLTISLCAFFQVVPSGYINLPSPAPLGDVSFYTNCPAGDGPVLGLRKGWCLAVEWQDGKIVAGHFEERLIVNVRYLNIQDALRGLPNPEDRDWWATQYVKFSNGRLCGPAGWNWN